MGYAVLLFLAAAVLFLVMVGLRRDPRRKSTDESNPGAPLIRNQPSADAPTPAKSVVESPAQADHAREHTPPA